MDVLFFISGDHGIIVEWKGAEYFDGVCRR